MFPEDARSKETKEISLWLCYAGANSQFYGVRKL